MLPPDTYYPLQERLARDSYAYVFSHSLHDYTKCVVFAFAFGKHVLLDDSHPLARWLVFNLNKYLTWKLTGFGLATLHPHTITVPRFVSVLSVAGHNIHKTPDK